jgi:hypothetical protein
VGRGLAAADLDGDGRLDLAYNPIDQDAVILKNEAPAGNAIEILPVAGSDRGPCSAPSSGRGPREEFVQPSYASLRAPAPFWDRDRDVRVSIRWPDGTVQDLGEVPAGAWKIRKEGLEPLRHSATPPDADRSRLNFWTILGL